MRKVERTGRIALALLLALLSAFWGPALAEREEAESPYVENEWNYVDGSIDPAAGIPEDATGVLDSIRSKGVLRVATEPYFPPQEFIDPSLEGQDSYVGADMELARLIAERMGVTLEIVPMDFSEVLNAVANGSCDLAISALSFTPGRAAMVEMSKGYHYAGDNAGSGLLIRAADADSIREVKDLARRDIGAQAGSLQEALMAENMQRYRQFRRLGSMQEVYQALIDGKIDAAMADIETAQAYIDSNPGCGLMLVPDVQFLLDAQFDGDRVAAKKGELQLMYFVNGVIDEVLESGRYEDWFEQYAAVAASLED